MGSAVIPGGALNRPCPCLWGERRLTKAAEITAPAPLCLRARKRAAIVLMAAFRYRRKTVHCSLLPLLETKVFILTCKAASLFTQAV